MSKRSRKQRAASRANALKSTGPKTEAGKAASRYNALKHGIYAQQQIMFDESAEDLAELDAEIREEHAPSNPTERMLVDTLVHNEWRLRRLRNVEAALWDQAAGNLAEAFVANAPALDRLQRIVNSCERNFHRGLKALKAAQAEARSAVEPSQPEESKTTSESLASSRQHPQTQPRPPLIPPQPPSDPQLFRVQGAPQAA